MSARDAVGRVRYGIAVLRMSVEPEDTPPELRAAVDKALETLSEAYALAVLAAMVEVLDGADVTPPEDARLPRAN